MTRLLLFSDSHEPAVAPAFDKRFLGWLNSTFKRRFQHDSGALDSAVKKMLELHPDAILFGGDAVSTSAPREFENALSHFLPLRDCGIPFYCVPGNHDRYVSNRKCRAAMEHFYDSVATAWARPEQPQVFRIGEIRLILLPEAYPALPWLSTGKLSVAVLDFLEAEATKDDPAPLVAFGHFPLLLDRNWRHGLKNADRARDLLESGKIALSLCGHMHHPQETEKEIVAPAVTRYAQITQIEYSGGKFSVTRIAV